MVENQKLELRTLASDWRRQFFIGLEIYLLSTDKERRFPTGLEFNLSKDVRAVQAVMMTQL